MTFQGLVTRWAPVVGLVVYTVAVAVACAGSVLVVWTLFAPDLAYRFVGKEMPFYTSAVLMFCGFVPAWFLDRVVPIPLRPAVLLGVSVSAAIAVFVLQGYSALFFVIGAVAMIAADSTLACLKKSEEPMARPAAEQTT